MKNECYHGLFLANKSDKPSQVDDIVLVLFNAIVEIIVHVFEVDIHHHIFNASGRVSVDVGSRHTALDVREFEMDVEDAFQVFFGLLEVSVGILPGGLLVNISKLASFWTQLLKTVRSSRSFISL